jgi:hypothetical protein
MRLYTLNEASPEAQQDSSDLVLVSVVTSMLLNDKPIEVIGVKTGDKIV